MREEVSVPVDSARAPVVAMLSAGQMGAAIGGVLKRDGGLDVVTLLDGRSSATRARAEAAGLRDAGSMEALVGQADIVLSVMSSHGALETAQAVAGALRRASRPLLFVDCNAISPTLAQQMAGLIEDAGAAFVDAAIQSPPPREPGAMIYASGSHAARLLVLNAHGLDIRLLDGPVGQASALDMICGGMVKLLDAAGVQIMLAARQWGLEGMLNERCRGLVKSLERFTPLMPVRATRWAEEMRETGDLMREMGLPAETFVGAAELLELIPRTEIGLEAEAMTQAEVIDAISRELARRGIAPPAATSGASDE